MSKQDEIKCLNSVVSAYTSNYEKKIIFDNSGLGLGGLLARARPNKDGSKFPDFVFNGGCIEHFQITSSKENKGGSSFKKEQSIVEKEETELIRNEQERFLNEPFKSGTIEVFNTRIVYEDFSFKWFIDSFEKNVAKHLLSLRSSNYLGKTVVFLIEQQTPRFYVDKGFTLEKYEMYELHRDKNLLEWIKNNCDGVNYIIYLAVDVVEILDLSKIDELIKNAKEYKNLKSGRHFDGTINSFINY